MSVEQALRAPESAEEAAGRGDLPTAPAGAVQGRTDAVELLLEEFRALRGAVEGMGGRLEALERENRELREQLQASLGAPDQDRQEELEAPTTSWAPVLYRMVYLNFREFPLPATR